MRSRLSAGSPARLLRRSAILVAVTLLGAAPVLLEGCADASGGQDQSLADAAPARSLTLELRDIAYEPSRIEVAAGEVIEVTLRNAGTLDHDFTIDTGDIDEYLLGPNAGQHGVHASRFALHAGPGVGGTLGVRLRVDEPGEYTFYCTVEGHREAGMEGTLVVR